MPREESPIFTEYSEWKKLVGMPEWKVYVRLMDQHAQHLQKEVNRWTREGNLSKAQTSLARKDEIPKMLGLVDNHMKSLNKQGDE